jgi:hypothetical protein
VRSSLACLLLLLPAISHAFTYSESIDGELSGDRLAPTTLAAQPGSNTLGGSTSAGDVEYVRVALPPQ